MTQQEENKIREEFQKFADSIIWSNDDGTEKYIGVGNMANWWIDVIKQRDEKMVKEIENSAVNTPEQVSELNKDLPNTLQEQSYHQAIGFHQGLQVALEVIRKYK